MLFFLCVSRYSPNGGRAEVIGSPVRSRSRSRPLPPKLHFPARAQHVCCKGNVDGGWLAQHPPHSRALGCMCNIKAFRKPHPPHPHPWPAKASLLATPSILRRK